MCAPALPLAIGIAGLAGAGASVYSASQRAKAQRRANAANERIAAQQAQAAETQFNKANQKAPDIAAIVDNNRNAMRGGLGATFLTGSQGVDQSQLQLGRASLLGF